jgi:hypothetical protein
VTAATTTTYRRTSGNGFHRPVYPARLPYCLGQRREVVHRGFRLTELAIVTYHVPAPRSGEPQRVPLAQVIGVRLTVGSQRTHHSGGIGVDKSERGNRRVRAPSPRAPPHAAHGRDHSAQVTPKCGRRADRCVRSIRIAASALWRLACSVVSGDGGDPVIPLAPA